MNNFPILSLLIFLPLIGVLVLLLQTNEEKSVCKSKVIALSFSLANLILSVILMLNFDRQDPNFQFEEKLIWIEKFNINYQLGIDGISLSFIVLSNLLITICILASWNNIKFRVKEYLMYFLLLEMAIIGVFAALDIILFYVFFEAILIPMYLIIGIWGGANRIYAAYKFFLYTLAGSLLFLLAIIYIYSHTSSMDLRVLMNEVPKFSFEIQKYLWLCFFASFAIKVPTWPFHTWLPDAHVQAPTAGSIILAGILIKVGAYGLIRFSLPLFPDASYYFKDFVFILSIIAIIYASLVAFVQTDIKKLIAYSSVAHMGFVTAGIFAHNHQSVSGAVIQMISHGLISGGLFFCVGVIYDRMHTRDIEKYGGIVEKMPKFAVCFMILTMASIGLPGTSGFVGEFLVFLGMFKENMLYALLMASGMVLGAMYMLSLYKRSIFGEANAETISLSDLEKIELVIFIILISLIIWIGIYPKIITNFINLAVNNLLI